MKSSTKFINIVAVLVVVTLLVATYLLEDRDAITSDDEISHTKREKQLEEELEQNLSSAVEKPAAEERVNAIVDSKVSSDSYQEALTDLKTPPPSLQDLTANQKFKSLPNPRLFAPERAERNAKIEAPKDAARAGDWEEFLKAAEELQIMSEKRFQNTILSAIKYDAPIAVFKELLKRGARFNSLHLGVLVRSNKVHLIQNLIPLGLDIHMKSRNGDNAINFVLETMSAREMFKFLLYQGVEVQNGSKVEDPLMFTLRFAEKQQQAIFFAYQLIRYGEKPGNEHLAQVQRLKTLNPSAYALIVERVPELI